MRRLLARFLSTAATLAELLAALLWLAHFLVSWEPERSDPWGEWADGDGRAALVSLERGGDGMI